MAKIQQTNNPQRQVISTLEDAHKYDMPDDRRLRVNADPLRMQIVGQDSSVTQLANALSAVKPELMMYGIQDRVETYEAQIQSGQMAATNGDVVPEEEMKRFGYDSIKSVNDATAFDSSMLADYEANFDKDNGNIEDFMQQHWDNSQPADQSSAYMSKFIPMTQKSMQSLREAHGKYQREKLDADTNTQLADLVYGDIAHASKMGVPWGVAEYEGRRADVRKMFPGKTNKELDGLVYSAVHRYAAETHSPDMLDVFKEQHSDGTPGMYALNWEKIDTDKNQLIIAANKDIKDKAKVVEDAAKEKSARFQNDVLLSIAELGGIEDETIRAPKLKELLASTRKAADGGMEFKDGFINFIGQAIEKNGKKEETSYQQQNARKMMLDGFTLEQLASAASREEISDAGFQRLMSFNQQKADRAQRAAEKNEKPYWTKDVYKRGVKDVREWAGYDAYNFAKDQTEQKTIADAFTLRYRETVDELHDSGMPIDQAVEKASTQVIDMMKKAGKASKERQDAEDSLHKLDRIKVNPKGYYESNLPDFGADLKAGHLPPNLTPREKEQLTDLLIADKAKKKKGKPTEAKVN